MPIRKKKKANQEKLNALLKSLMFSPEAWENRKVYTRTKFLEMLYLRMRRLMANAANELVLVSLYGKKFDENIKTLDEWLDDDNIDVQALSGLKNSLGCTLMNYTNIINTLDMREKVKIVDQSIEYIYLEYDAPPELKGYGEMVYVFLDKESYELVNDSLNQIKKNLDSDNSLYI